MKKLAFLVGAGAGFVLGSKAGSGPYEQLEAKVHGVMGRPEVRKAADDVKSAAKDQASAIIDKLPTSSNHDGTDVPDMTLPPEPGVYGASPTPLTPEG